MTSPLHPSSGTGATPGPWHVDGEALRTMVRGADMTIVAVRHRLSAVTHEANCRLIAACPDLRDALDAMLAAFGEDEAAYTPCQRLALTAARAALRLTQAVDAGEGRS